MNRPFVGWVLAALALIAGYAVWGWPGVMLALTVLAFWLLLQWSRALRALRAAAGAPVGTVPSAVMLHASLRRGMSLQQILPLTGSLGRRQETEADEERWAWRDGGGRSLVAVLQAGRLIRWSLDETDASTPAAPVGHEAHHP